MSYSYILRYAVQPGFHVDEKLEQLVAYCKNGRIDDVMFFVNEEDLNQGHLTLEETVPWMEVIAKAKPMLSAIGVTTSINPWSTLIHSNSGRTLRPGQKIELMMDSEGKQSTAVACPLGPEWRNYISEMYAYYATLEPNMIWVEDDFRLHNHRPMKWGGCFCDVHMAEFSRRIGRTVSREEFIAGVIKPGEPHPFRKVWLDTGRDTMSESARRIGEAVHKVSPKTIVGLMSSYPEVHCAEGRDWNGILSGLAGSGTPMVDRPSLGAYSEEAAPNYLWAFMTNSRMVQAVAPESTDLYPELENFPYTRLSKSHRLTQFQIESCFSLAPKGITINVESMGGNGIMVEEGNDKVLAAMKDFAERVTELGLSSADEVGVQVLASTKSSYTLNTPSVESMEELYPVENFWAGLLSSYGIANRYCMEKIPSGGVVAVSGQYFRNLSRAEIEKLFADNFVLLEGEAAFTLLELGLGDIVGIRGIKTHIPESGVQSYEQVCDGKIYCGLKEARASAHKGSGRFLEIDYSRAPLMKTVAKSPAGRDVFPGMVVQGRCFILPWGWVVGRNIAQFMSPVRQEVIQDVLVSSGSVCPIFVKKWPYVTVNVYKKGGKTTLLLTNWTLDDVDSVRLYAPGLSIEGLRELSRKSGLVAADIVREGDDVVLRSGLKGLTTKVIVG